MLMPIYVYHLIEITICGFNQLVLARLNHFSNYMKQLMGYVVSLHDTIVTFGYTEIFLVELI